MIKYCPNCGYNLTDVTSETTEAPQRGSSEVVGTKNDVLDEYSNPDPEIAVPKVSEYRERFKTRRLRGSDIKAETKILPLTRNDGELDKFGDLVFGEGIQQEV